jgi:Prephenate dehydratase
MVKIESRPIINKSFELLFYIDFEGNLEDKVVKEAIRAIRDNSCDFKLLGNYKAHNINNVI